MAKRDLEFMPLEELKKIPGWERKLTQGEKQEVVSLSELAGEEFENLGRRRARLGEIFRRLQSILEPKRMFRPWVKKIPFGFPIRTVYRYIEVFNESERAKPSPYVRMGMLANIDRLNLPKVRSIPAPKSNDPEKVKEYMESVQEKIERDPNVLKKIVVNTTKVCYAKLPADWEHEQRTEWMRSVCGMQLMILGISQPVSVTPEAIPIDWGRGRKAS